MQLCIRDRVCDLCGRPMVIKGGKYGKFLACSGFPECRGTKRLVKDTGGICPKCGKGRLLERCNYENCCIFVPAHESYEEQAVF